MTLEQNKEHSESLLRTDLIWTTDIKLPEQLIFRTTDYNLISTTKPSVSSHLNQSDNKNPSDN